MKSTKVPLSLPQHPSLLFGERPAPLSNAFDANFMTGRIRRLVEQHAQPSPFDFKNLMLPSDYIPDDRLPDGRMRVTASFNNWDKDSAELGLMNYDPDQRLTHIAAFAAKLGSSDIRMTVYEKAAPDEVYGEPFKAKVPATQPEMVVALNYLAASCGERPIIIPESDQVAALQSMGFQLGAGAWAVSQS